MVVAGSDRGLSGAGIRERGSGRREVATEGVQAAALDEQPQTGLTERRPGEPEAEEPVRLVPRPEGDRCLRRDREDLAAVGPLDPEDSDTLPSLTCHVEGLACAPDAVEQSREVRSSQRDPLGPPELVRDRVARADRRNACLHASEEGEVPAEDPERERLVAS